MKPWLMAAVAILCAAPLLALDGEPGMHDPSTVVVHDGRFYAFGTGGGLPILDLRRWMDVAARRRR